MNTATVPIADLNRDNNVRRTLGDLTTLTESISQVGILQPVTITPTLHGYELVAGHRRVAAAEAAGLHEVPVFVIEFASEDDRLVATLVENLIRDDLDPIDEAGGFQQLIEAGWSRDKIATKVTRSKAHISKRVRLLALPDDLKDKVAEGKLTVDHGYALARLADKGVTAKKLETLSKKQPYAADDALSEIAAQKKLDERLAELKSKGGKVQYAKEWWNLPDGMRQVKHMRMDEATHVFEPCHVIIVTRSYTAEPIEELAICDDNDRHLPDGDSTLKVSDAAAASAERDTAREAEEAAQKEAKRQRRSEIQDGIQTLKDKDLIDTTVRILAVDKLPRVAGDDPFVKYTDEEREESGWKIPGPAIARTTIADLCRAFLRGYLLSNDNSWWGSQQTGELMALVNALSDRLGVTIHHEEEEEDPTECASCGEDHGTDE